jgi:eukaryotic-like serine/threonine-protein kinase
VLGFVELIGQLLSELHRAQAVDMCPGDWAWTASFAGAVFGLLPAAGAMLVAAVRRWTGNRYGAAQLAAFGAIGFLLVGVLPLWSFRATSQVFRGAAGGREVGLVDDRGTLESGFCLDGQPQVDYLGGATSVRAAIGELPGGGVRTGLAGLISVGAPLLALLFVYIQARAAFRRGPGWPARLFWLPVLLLVVGTASLSVTVVAHLWLGFVPATVVGIFAVLLVGAPGGTVLSSSGRDQGAGPPPRRAGAYPDPANQHQYQHQPARLPQSQPHPQLQPRGQPRFQQPMRQLPPPPGPSRQLPPTLVAPDPSLGRPPERVVPAAGRLAAEPGPIPASLQQALAGNPAAGGPSPAAAGSAGAATEKTGAAGEADGSGVETAMLPSSRFQRIRRLGAGGFGQVWLAMDTKLGRTVAVKVATAYNAETEQRIRREARALAAVHHPNCVRIYDILDDLDGGGVAIVMEYVPGRPLGDLVRDNRMTDADVARLWHTLAGALHAAHGNGVLHRDVKPSNIIIAGNGAPRLIDFGIARATGDVTLTAAGIVIGTPDFLPPEIAAGRPPGPASDTWQLAAVVSFALTGTPPRGHSDGAVAAMLAAARGEPCNQLPPVSAHRALLERSLDPNPAARPALPAVQAELNAWVR